MNPNTVRLNQEDLDTVELREEASAMLHRFTDNARSSERYMDVLRVEDPRENIDGIYTILLEGNESNYTVERNKNLQGKDSLYVLQYSKPNGHKRESLEVDIEVSNSTNGAVLKYEKLHKGWIIEMDEQQNMRALELISNFFEGFWQDINGS